MQNVSTLSEGAVPARVHVATVSRRFPQILVGLAEGRISLTALSLLAPHLTEDNAEKHMAEILEKALDIALEKKDPQKKLERRQKREKAVKASSRSDEVAEKDEGEPSPLSRHIPTDVRERVTASSGHQCEFKSDDGTRCTARTGLQIDHSRPFALFPSHDERFLRVLCRAHNLLMAERVTGRAFIQRKISGAPRGAVP